MQHPPIICCSQSSLVLWRQPWLHAVLRLLQLLSDIQLLCAQQRMVDYDAVWYLALLLPQPTESPSLCPTPLPCRLAGPYICSKQKQPLGVRCPKMPLATAFGSTRLPTRSHSNQPQMRMTIGPAGHLHVIHSDPQLNERCRSIVRSRERESPAR